MDPFKLLAKFTQKIANLNKNQTHEITSIKNCENFIPENRNLQLETHKNSSQNNDLIQHSNNLQTNKLDLNIQKIDVSNGVDLVSEQKQVEQKQVVIPQQENNSQGVDQNSDKKMFQQRQEQDQQRCKAKADQNLQKSHSNEHENDLHHQIKLKIKKDAQNLTLGSSSNSNLVQKETYEPINKVCKSLPINNNYEISNQNEDKINSLTDGRQYDESFRRKFVKKLMKSISIEKPGKINELIKNASHSIEVHIYEVKIWLTSYKLIFSVERYISERQGNVSAAEKIKVIKKELLSFLLKNKNQKRYRIVKILNYLFQTLGFSEIKTHAWVTEFFNQYSKELRGMQIAQSRSNKEKSNDESSSDDQKQKDKISSKRGNKTQKRNELFQKQKATQQYEMQQNQMLDSQPSKKKMRSNNNNETSVMINQNMNPKRNVKMGEIEKKVENPLSPQNRQDISMYPQAFKRKMSERISNQIIKSIDDILKSKSEEFCLTYNTIKCIYQENGQFIIKTKNQSDDLNQMGKKNVMKRTNNETTSIEMRNLSQKSVGAQKSIHSLNQIKNSNKPSFSSSKNQQINQNKSFSNGGKAIQNNIPQNIQNQNLLQKLQIRLLNFLRLNMNCLISVVEKQTESHMEQNKFNEKLKNQVRNQWFCHFLRKNKYSISPERRVIKILSQTNNGAIQRNPQVPGSRSSPNSVQMGSSMKQTKPYVDQNGTNKSYFMN